MSAADTASQVLAWAAGEEVSGSVLGVPEGPGVPGVPGGTLAGLAELAAPPPGIRGQIGRLAAIAAARLRLTAPPLGDPRPPGPAVAIMAAAVGSRGSIGAGGSGGSGGVPAWRVLDVLADEDAEPAYELAARHAVAGRVLRSGQLDDTTTGLMRDLSPLTGLLDHPTGSGEDAAEDLLVSRLLPDPEGYRLAVRTFAAPASSAAQAAWRAGLLARFRHGPRLPFVLDVYETGMTTFGAAHRRRLELARGLLGYTADLDAIRPLVQWWQPLSEIERRRPQEIKRRRLISNDYVTGVRAYRRFAALETAATMAAPRQGEQQ
ncbi:MAG: hypothetical protein JO345_19980 [Streptosporangiaceae bacterium]|nr:hypothetical protein [Streptosporangiaceae bacterium]